VAANTYATIASDVNYTIQAGDYLEYEVLIPKESTLASGAVDLTFSAAPKAAHSGDQATLRDSFIAVDQYGLFAHPASNYDLLTTRTTQACDASGKPVNTPVFQRGQWFKRDIDLSALRVDAGGNPVTITNVAVAIDEHNSSALQDVCPDPANNTAIAMFRNINIKNRDAQGMEVVKKAIYNGEAKLPNGQDTLDVTGDAAKGTASVTDFTATTTPPATGGGTGGTGTGGTGGTGTGTP